MGMNPTTQRDAGACPTREARVVVDDGHTVLDVEPQLRLFGDADFGSAPGSIGGGNSSSETRPGGGERRSRREPHRKAAVESSDGTFTIAGDVTERGGLAERPGIEAVVTVELAPRLVTVADAARLLGIGRSTVYELITAGELHLVHIRRSARVSVEAIDAFVARLQHQADNGASAHVRRSLP